MIKIFQIDAFATRVFEGNPAAVCPLTHWLPDNLLQHIATENNLSETAFIVAEADGYRIRWFTPNGEVDLCGHATLAAAEVVFMHLNYPKESILFYSKSGGLKVRRKQERLYQLDFPRLNYAKINASQEMVAALSTNPKAVYESSFDLLCIFDNENDIINSTPNLSLIAQWPYRGVIFTSQSKRADIYSRCFYPKFDVPEDPVTGSAHCVIAPYWANELNKSTIHALQGLKRQGQLICTVTEDRVLLAGECHMYLEGNICLPSVDTAHA